MANWEEMMKTTDINLPITWPPVASPTEWRTLDYPCKPFVDSLLPRARTTLKTPY
ncbi:hypothetical protein [Glaciimonas immobilis]|uniref:Uncharacterized protein n=1 Tax=Glaciimonas immobilis TaxID=728004 RepID=A0A840RX58_9BURK|nr:hypothetical protein [Glaciimonas immobilis]KAF3996508.1 hypothetical protein HAV38_17870 [Glaciimonas immobilis]MBB5201131.1 hypothetical protein [Glaciimonas immobilis]